MVSVLVTIKELKYKIANKHLMSIIVNAVINCYLLSPALPQLQINVTKEIASGVIKGARMSVQIFKDAEVS